MNLFALSSLSCGISSFVLTLIYILFGRSKEHRLLGLDNIAVVFWGVGLFFVGTALSEERAMLAWKIALLGGTFIGVFFYHLVYIFCRLNRKKFLYLAYAETIIFNLLNFGTNFAVNNGRHIFNLYYPRTTTILLIQIFVYLTLIILSYYELFKYWHKTSNLKKVQTSYLMFGFMFGFIGGTSVLFPFVGLDIYPIGNFGILIYSFVVAYAILRYQLLGIKLALSRAALYCLIAICLIGVPIGFTILSPYSLAGLSLGITCLILAFISLSFARAKVHYLMAMFNMACCVWGVGAFIVGQARNISVAVFGWKFAHVGAIFIALGFYHLVVALCHLNRKWVLRFIYLIGFIYLYCEIFTDLYISPQLRIAFNSLYYQTATPFFNSWLFIWGCIVIASFIELLRFILSAKGFERKQAIYIFLGFLIGFIGGTSTLLPAYKIDIVYPFGNFTILLYSLLATYAILKYRILDINIALTRIGIFVVVYFPVVFVPFWIAPKFIHTNLWWIPMLALLIFSTSGPFIYMFLQRKTLNRLLADEKHAHNLLLQASQGMTQVRNLSRLIKLIVHFITKSLKTKNAQVFLLDQNSKLFMLKASRFYQTNILNLDSSDSLIQYLKRLKGPLVYEEIKFLMPTSSKDNLVENFKTIEIQMKSLNAAVIIPCLVGDNLLGFLTLDEKISSKMYSQEDLNVLTTLANQAALAIENAQFFEEVQQTQEQLFQAEKMATLGTMADGLSHQINNRFNALGLIAADTADTLNMLDKNNLNSECQNTLSQIKNALNRIEDNVKSGGEIVKGLLKYSRPGQEGFEPVSLDTIIDSALEMAQYKVKLNEIEIRRNYDKDLPKVKVNLTQLQEVFFNLIDNAYFATEQRKEELKEEDYKGCIDFSAKVLDGKCQIKVSDNGIGVKKEDFNKLFTPFFTTKATSNKGTGLGLFVIQKIITNNHKGSISVESTYKQGTTFIIELPLSV